MTIWLYNDTTGTTYSLDENVVKVTFPQMDRNYTVNNLSTDGATVTGTGSFMAGAIQISRKFTRNDQLIAWDDTRYALQRFIGAPKTHVLYFYLTDKNGVTMRQRIYPMSRNAESYSKLWISDDVSFLFQMEKAYLYNTTATSGTYVVTSNQTESFTITNNGMLQTAPSFTFTPTGNFSTLQIQLAYNNYGFTLVSSFIAGKPITFDCTTGTVTVDGVVTTGIQTAGSLFYTMPGANLIYIYAAAGTLVWSENDRYI